MTSCHTRQAGSVRQAEATNRGMRSRTAFVCSVFGSRCRGPRASSRTKCPLAARARLSAPTRLLGTRFPRSALRRRRDRLLLLLKSAPPAGGVGGGVSHQRTRVRTKRASCWKGKVVKYLWSRRLACYRYSGISVKAKRCHWLESGLPFTAPDEGPLPDERRQVTDRLFRARIS